MVYDLGSGRRESQYLSLAGTTVNCAGGPTPWGVADLRGKYEPGRRGGTRSMAGCSKCRRGSAGLVNPEPLRGLGRFNHEAAAVDPATGMVYLTEDRDEGLLYRFIPETARVIGGGGRLQALAMRDAAGADSRNWQRRRLRAGNRREVRWIDLAKSPNDDLRERGPAAGATLFARGEGIIAAAANIISPAPGAVRQDRPDHALSAQPPRRSAERREIGAGAARAVRDIDQSRVMDYGDNLIVAPWGHLIVCEDRADNKVNHLKGVTAGGKVYALARLNLDTELAGVLLLAGRVDAVRQRLPSRQDAGDHRPLAVGQRLRQGSAPQAKVSSWRA